jgi:hypothetical protein
MGAWGLSMFTTAEAIQKKFGKLIAKYPNIANDIGDHIAEGTLHSSHGVITKPNKHHHFNLFEFVGIDVSVHFRVIGKLNIVRTQ